MWALKRIYFHWANVTRQENSHINFNLIKGISIEIAFFNAKSYPSEKSSSWLYSGAEIESAKMSELNVKLYFRVAFLALLLPFASGERNIIRYVYKLTFRVQSLFKLAF